jgi:hypothetical protein
VLLQPGQAGGQHRDLRERKTAQHHRVQRHRIARIGVAIDRIQADHFAGQVEAEHMFAPVAVDDVGLDRAGAHRSDGPERIADAEHMLAGTQRADVLDQHVQVDQRGLVHALRQACLRESAGRAETQRVAIIGDDAAVDVREGGVAHGARPTASALS